MATGSITMNESFARRPVEQLNRARLVRGGRAGPASFLQRRAESRTLSAVTNGGRFGLPKVLGRRSNSWQGKGSNDAKNGVTYEPRSIGSAGSEVKQGE